jgi:predicted ABC-type transport system involved in lysophospholipase L1 biosynthesis ATPase subunit
MLPLNLRGEPAASSRDQARAMLAELGLDAYLAHRPDQLSGG